MDTRLARQFFSPRMLVAFLMGFACGMPLLLTSTVLQAWMTDQGVDLATIGFFSLVGLPYTLKFLWAPVFDRFTPPFLGRRRGWLLIIQLLLILALVGLGSTDPAQTPWLVALAAFFVTLFSASQDTVVDAYRREDLTDNQLGLGSSLYVNGYRLGMLLAGSGGLILADHVSFSHVYLLMAASLLLGAATTLLCREPPLTQGTPGTFKEAVVEPFVDYFSRDKALWLLLFILLYKIGDQMASTLTTPFYLSLGFSKSQIGAVAKLAGVSAAITGGLLGGVILLRIGIIRSLWLFGILQAAGILSFTALALIGNSLPGLTLAIVVEQLTSGMGTSAYVAYMASITNKRFTATQYALLSSCMGIPRVIIAAPAGILAEVAGWPLFFLGCALAAIPGLLMLPVISKQYQRDAQ
ncbi:MAG TPA: AmpG family muropeptide MFS transporter [Desulfobulbaceae bacterium]|nr:AmpG family muropeptide MFS transporter [Desulfobulbaceae bacterium]